MTSPATTAAADRGLSCARRHGGDVRPLNRLGQAAALTRGVVHLQRVFERQSRRGFLVRAEEVGEGPSRARPTSPRCRRRGVRRPPALSTAAHLPVRVAASRRRTTLFRRFSVSRRCGEDSSAPAIERRDSPLWRAPMEGRRHLFAGQRALAVVCTRLPVNVCGERRDESQLPFS